MYIFKNALKNIFRNFGRNILIAAIIFAIITTTIVALIINNTSDAVIANYKDRFASEVSISPDMKKIQEQAKKEATENGTPGMLKMKRPEISSELLLQFAKSECLKESYAYASIGANNEEITAIDQDAQDDDNNNNNSFSGGMTTRMLGSDTNFKLYGDYWQDFTEGDRELEDDGISRMPETDNECIISKEIADENGINVGDTLKFTSTLGMDIPEGTDVSDKKAGDTITINGTEYKLESGMGDELHATREVTYELPVVGIYLDLTDEYPDDNMQESASMNRRNEVLTTFNTLLSQRKTDETSVRVDATYYLKDPSLLSQFEEEVRAMGLSDMFNVTTDTASYEKIVKPVEGLKSISLTFMIVVIALGAIILLLLLSISIRERKYEIGVLRAMGMKKGKVALGLMTEILAITCACLIIGIGTGVAVAQPVTNVLLEQQVAAQEEQNNQSTSGNNMAAGGATMIKSASLSPSGNSNVKPLSEMEITIGFDTILEIIAIALALALLASLFSISKITKYEPIKILMERN